MGMKVEYHCILHLTASSWVSVDPAGGFVTFGKTRNFSPRRKRTPTNRNVIETCKNNFISYFSLIHDLLFDKMVIDSYTWKIDILISKGNEPDLVIYTDEVAIYSFQACQTFSTYWKQILLRESHNGIVFLNRLIWVNKTDMSPHWAVH